MPEALASERSPVKIVACMPLFDIDVIVFCATGVGKKVEDAWGERR